MRNTLFIFLAIGVAASAQTPRPITLSEARALAAKSNPQISAAVFRAKAAEQTITETRSAFYPTITANVTAADALDSSRIAAGLLNNPSVFSRAAAGVTATQLLSDFGRTSNLTASSRLQSLSQQQLTDATKAGVLLRVDEAFYALLRANAVRRVATETLKERQGVLEQVKSLAENKLRSSLDVSFSSVAVSEAKLLMINAQNDQQAAQAAMSTVLGFRDAQEFDPIPESLPPPLAESPKGYLDTALIDRPDLASLRSQRDAQNRFAEAEHDLSRPTLSAVGVAGKAAFNDDRLANRYAAAGINLSIPVFNGNLFAARHDEALLRARALDESVRDLENQVTRDVRVAWLGARTAFERMQTTTELLDNATQSLDLAQARYNLGLSAIVELNQAQLNKTSAEIAVAGARYEYQLQRTILDYQTGNLR